MSATEHRAHPRRAHSTAPRRRALKDTTLMPTADGVPGGVVERPCHEAALGDLDLILGLVGHGQVGRAAVERIEPGQPRMIVMYHLPKIHVSGRVQVIYRAGLASLVLDRR